MSAVFQSGYSNLGQRALERATDAANKYNQKLQKKEMVSQTEESLGGIKAFTSGRELFKSIGEKSKLKPYLKQEADKQMKSMSDGWKDFKSQWNKKAQQPKPEPTDDEISKMADELKANQGKVNDALDFLKSKPDDPIVPEFKAARSISNDVSEARLGRIGRIAQIRKAKKIKNGMSEEDAEEDMNNYIMDRAQGIVNKNKLNDSFQNSADAANEQAQAEAKAATEARANLKAAAEDKPAAPTTKAKVKGKGEEEEGAEEGEEGAEGAAEGGEIGGMEALGSILDAIPGLDIIGAALGLGGIAAGAAKKPPQQLASNPNIRSSASYSQQLGIDA